MHARDDDDQIGVDPIVETVWEAPKQGPAGISMNHWMKLRGALDGYQGVV
jgi:hypothetical protein